MGHIKTTEKEKKLYYSRQCQLVWHAAVSPTLLPIHKKKKKKHILISWRLYEQYHITNNPLPARWPPSHMAPGRTETQRSQETEGLVPPSVSVVGNLPVVPKNASHNRHSALINTQPETKAHACPQKHMYSVTPTFSPPSLPALEPSCLIKSISCASAVPRQMTFKQVLLLGGEQMGVEAEFVYKSQSLVSTKLLA